jgi:hypothetical protein
MSKEGYRRAHPVDSFWFNKRADAMSEHEAKSDFWSRHFPTFLGAPKKLPLIAEDRIYRLLVDIDAERRKLVAAADEKLSPTWLVPFRHTFRQIEASQSVASIKRYLNRCPPEMVPLCVWLIGRMADRLRLWGLHHEWDHPSAQVRWQVAKALRQAEAWRVLEKMARREPQNERLQHVAMSPASRRPFSARLQAYKRDVDDSHADEVVTPSRMPYWARDKAWEYTPPKSRDLIRRMLRRIRHWVRWGAT